MKREFSAGGIVLRQAQDKFSKNKVEVLLTQHSSNHHWGFPKGHLEEGESSKQAALREVQEETGIKAEIVEKVGESKYIFTKNGEKLFKVVTIFLMKYVSGQIKFQADELIDVRWFSPEEALERLSFPRDKDLLKQVLKTKS